MKPSKIVAALLSAGAIAAATPAIAQQQHAPANQQSAQQPKVKPSAKALKAILDLQTAVDKKDFANIPAKVAAAQAVATTKEDRYLIGELQLRSALLTNDNAAMAAAIDAIAASNYLDPPKIAEIYSQLGGTLLNAKQYAQAAAAFRKAAAIEPGDAETQRLLGVSLFEQGQKADAVTAFQKAIQASAATGKKPDEDLYRMAVQAAYDSRLPAASDLARQWAAAYPSKDSWHNAVAIYRNLDRPDAEGTLDLMRLLALQGDLTTPGEYALYAGSAVEQGNFTEAQAVIDQGIAAKIVSPNDPDLRDIVADLKKEPKATEAGLAEAIGIAKESLPLVHIGDRYAAMGEYPKAQQAYRLALAKPGADPNLVNLHLGMALARQGDKTGATAAFKSVSGPLAGIAQFWLTYLSTKS